MQLIRRNRPNGGRNELSFPWSNSLWDVDRWFDSLFSAPWTFDSEVTSWVPPMDVTETEKNVVIRSEIPGVDPKELSITVDDGVLTLAGEKKETSEHQGEEGGHSYHRTERRFGSFERQLRLPTSVDAEKVKAEYESGVLTVTLEKKVEAVPKRIPVSSK